MSLLLDNPVVVKEFRSRMRGSRAYWLLFAYVLILALTLFFAYLSWWNTHTSSSLEPGGHGAAGFTVGRTFFLTLFWAQAILVTLITPALTAGAISIEREQRTFELLRSTTLPPKAIALGKLASSVSFIVLLLTSSLPLVSVCFLLGGVSPGEVFFSYLLLVCDAFAFGAVGLCWSAYAANTATATALSYATIVLWFFLSLPFAMAGLSSNGQVSFLETVNPLGAVSGALNLERYYQWNWPAWVAGLAINGTLGLLLTLACVNRLQDRPARTAGWLRLTALVFVGLLFFFGAGIAFSPAFNGMKPSDRVTVVSVILTLLPFVFVPVFVTGEWGDRKSFGVGDLLSAWSPRRVFGDATLPSGLPFAVLLTALLTGIGAWAARQAAVQAFPAGAAVARPHLEGVLLSSGLMTLAVVFGVAGLGFFLSAALKNRWGAMTLTFLLTYLGWAMPFFTFALLRGSDALAAHANPMLNTLYLCPLFGPLQLGMPRSPVNPPATDPFEDAFPVVTGLAGYGEGTLWIVTSLLYMALGLLFYGMGLKIAQRAVRRAA